MSDKPKIQIAAQIRSAKTPAEALRETMKRLEAQMGKLSFGEEEEAVEILGLFDRADGLMQEIAERGGDLEAERARFNTVTQQLRRKGKTFIKRLGGAEAMRRLRERHDPPPEHTWWFIDVYLAEQRQAQRKETLRIVAIAAVVLAALTGLYQLFLAPDEITRERIRYEQRAERAITEGDAATALTEVDQALTLVPGDPDMLLLKGVILQVLERPDEAEATFEAAKAGLDDPALFYIARAETYQRAGMPAEALEDAEAILALDSTSAIGYFHMGSANAALGNLIEASDNYERASELARAEGNTELEGMARVQLANLMMMMMVPQQPAPEVTPSEAP